MWNPFNIFSKQSVPESGEHSVPVSVQASLNKTINQINGNIINDTPKDATAIENFINESPNSLYIIDGKKGVNQSIICRAKPGGGKTCLKLDYEEVELFKRMQHFEYFCSLPNDMSASYFECRKIK